MKAFKLDGSRWFACRKVELVEAWERTPVLLELAAYQVIRADLVPVGDELHAVPVVCFLTTPEAIASHRGWGAVPRCREVENDWRCELAAQHAGLHESFRGALRWERAELPWAELNGSKLERYRLGLIDLQMLRRELSPLDLDEEDRRAVVLNDLWWQLSPAEQLDFELWWAERLRIDTRSELGRGLLLGYE